MSKIKNTDLIFGEKEKNTISKLEVFINRECLLEVSAESSNIGKLIFELLLDEKDAIKLIERKLKNSACELSDLLTELLSDKIDRIEKSETIKS